MQRLSWAQYLSQKFSQFKQSTIIIIKILRQLMMWYWGPARYIYGLVQDCGISIADHSLELSHKYMALLLLNLLYLSSLSAKICFITQSDNQRWHLGRVSEPLQLYYCIKQIHVYYLYIFLRVVSQALWKSHQRDNPVAIMMSPNENIFPVTGPLWWESTSHWWIPSQRPVTRSFDVFFDLRLNKCSSKQSRHRWFETPL